MLDTLGPKTLFIVKFSGFSFMSGKDFLDLIKRPNLSADDARAIGRLDLSSAYVDVMYGGGFAARLERIVHERNRTKQMMIVGASENFAAVNHVAVAIGRPFTETEVRHGRPVVVLGNAPYRALFQHLDPLGKDVRIGDGRYRVVGVLGRRPSPGGFDVGTGRVRRHPVHRLRPSVRNAAKSHPRSGAPRRHHRPRSRGSR